MFQFCLPNCPNYNEFVCLKRLIANQCFWRVVASPIMHLSNYPIIENPVLKISSLILQSSAWYFPSTPHRKTFIPYRHAIWPKHDCAKFSKYAVYKLQLSFCCHINLIPRSQKVEYRIENWQFVPSLCSNSESLCTLTVSCYERVLD